jgi:hypothetical protein
MSQACISEQAVRVSCDAEPSNLQSVYVATGAEALKNWQQNRANRWYKDGADPGDLTGDYAFQRLRRTWFTPKIDPKFKFRPEDKLFAIGSCFARGIEQALVALGMDVLSAAPEFSSFQTVRKDVTSLGFTNKYNTFSIYNELLWALDLQSECPPASIVHLENGVFIDPHVTQMLQLAGEEETWRRRSLIQIVNGRVAQARVVIITLGLVEVWRDTLTNTFINITPTLQLSNAYPNRYEFHVSSFAQNQANLGKIYALLERFGHPEVQIVVTVSPVPLLATFSGQDVVLANTYSKSLLRAAAQEWAAKHENVHYFPSYEIVYNSDRNETWGPDLRHVKREMSNHIMDLFVENYLV